MNQPDQKLKVVPITRHYVMDAADTIDRAHLLHDGRSSKAGTLTGGQKPVFCAVPLQAGNAITTLETDGVVTFPEALVPGCVIFVKNGYRGGIEPGTAWQVDQLTRWTAVTIETRTDDYTLEVDAAIDVPDDNEGFAFLLLATELRSLGAEGALWIPCSGYNRATLAITEHSAVGDVHYTVDALIGDHVSAEAWWEGDVTAGYSKHSEMPIGCEFLKVSLASATLSQASEVSVDLTLIRD